ncbi:MAG: universal stress protein [Sphingomonadales bacterium]|nr:universal stress protein [Sphingomonadales bacterium]
MAARRHELPRPFRRSEPLVAVGHPADQILRTIKSEDIDLVVLGARALRPFDRWLLGSTSETIVAHATCSVLVVRE